MAKPLMILGTSSGAGKSTIATGLCRIFSGDGFDTVPFKAQNMSGNAHVLPDGRQMARSQAIAAYACGIEPEADMNPLLLKYSPGKLEYIVQGQILEGLDQPGLVGMKRDLVGSIMESYGRVTGGRDIVVLEGAGSPVEMNLKDQDIGNISMAMRVQAPVLLVADIDRGGAFASVYGTLMLLPEEERRLIRGIIINRIKGDASSFSEVKNEMERITGRPVAGMVPYLALTLEDEDGFTDPQTGRKPRQERAVMEEELDHLAEALRQHLDMETIYNMIHRGV